jgi:hypothetical protein
MEYLNLNANYWAGTYNAPMSKALSFDCMAGFCAMTMARTDRRARTERVNLF